MHCQNHIKFAGNFFTSWRRVAGQGGLCSTVCVRLMRILGVTGGWTKFYVWELHELVECSPTTIRAKRKMKKL